MPIHGGISCCRWRVQASTPWRRICVAMVGALVELQPEHAEGFDFIIVHRNGHPILASSPYTGLVTSEDAGQHVPNYFQFARTGK